MAPADLAPAVAPSGAAVAPSGAAASGEAAKADKPARATKPATAPLVPASGMMSHGKVEDGTLKYNPPPQQNPPRKEDLKQ